MKENWKKYGMVDVSRDAKGRLLTWQKWIPTAKYEYGDYGLSGKCASLYGTAYARGNTYHARFDFQGSGKELFEAVRLGHHYVPHPKKRFVRVSAKEFLRDPERYGWRGYWIEREVSS